MNKNEAYILWFKDLTIEDVPLVGGKNAALGEMYANLVPLGINVPNGFALTATAYRFFLKEAGLEEKIEKALDGLDTGDITDLQTRAKKVRNLITKASLPQALVDAVTEAYATLGKDSHANPDVAVRSSATAEDLPGASFAGQQETYLNVHGVDQVLESTKNCIASLFTDRAISYRVDKGFSHLDTSLSVGVQTMVRSDMSASGVAFTIDTETGFNKVVIVTGSYGLGEMIVQGKVTPDEFMLFKPALTAKNKQPIISRKLGVKNQKLIYAKQGIVLKDVSAKDQRQFCITDEEVITLGNWCKEIEDYFSKRHGHYQAMDIEWAKDGITGALYIVQARPETVHAGQDKNVYKEYRLHHAATARPLLTGIPVGTKIGSGAVRIIRDARHIKEFKPGEVLVTEITDPDWEPIMKIASAIITDKGGRTSHAAIVSRELGIPCIVGSAIATKTLKQGQVVTVDCSAGNIGRIFEGTLSFDIVEHRLDKIPETKTKVMVNIGSPSDAFMNHYLPVKGVGLGRLEFIIATEIRIHPRALLDYDAIKLEAKKSREAAKLIAQIDEITVGYDDKVQYYVDRLAEGIAKIGSVFWQNDVIIRFSDFKTNEYRTLIGGDRYEPSEENPMLGWRGASRYYDKKFQEAFRLECRAMKIVRKDMGLINIIPMIPFCRTPEEGRKVIEIMEAEGLNRSLDKTLKVYVMCEIPSNILRANEFLSIFDGMSIGSNDLTQLTLGLDRDSGIVSGISNENDPAVKELITMIIKICLERNKYIGICGQAPSDYPDFASFLVKAGIHSISLNPDTVLQTIMVIAKSEAELEHNS